MISIGLKNLGNKCYLNVIIQTLYNLKVFRNYLNDINTLKELVNNDIDSIDNINGIFNTLTYKLKNLFYIMSIHNNTYNNTSPLEVLNCLQEKSMFFNGVEEQDAVEAFNIIVNILCDENKNAQKIFDISLNKMFKCEFCNTDQSGTDTYSIIRIPITLPIHDPNDDVAIDNGTIDYKEYFSIKSKIKHIKITKKMFKLLYDNLTEQEKNVIKDIESNKLLENIDVDIDKCVYNILLENDVIEFKCNACTMKNENILCIKNVDINYLPDIITIQLQRFVYNDVIETTKLNNNVDFNFTLTIKNIVYVLKSIIIHIGNHNTGHYINCLIGTGEDDIYLCNDKNIKKYTLHNLYKNYSTDIYMLIYEKVM